MFRRKHFLAPTHTLSPKIAYGIIAPVTFSPNEPRKKVHKFDNYEFFVDEREIFNSMKNLTCLFSDEIKNVSLFLIFKLF